MKEKLTINIDPEDAKQAMLKGLKELSREQAKNSRSLVGQTFENKKKRAGGSGERQKPKRMRAEDLDDEDLEEIREKLKEDGDEEKFIPSSRP